MLFWNKMLQELEQQDISQKIMKFDKIENGISIFTNIDHLTIYSHNNLPVMNFH